MINWILASASPRRRDILSHLGLSFTVCVADVDENIDEPSPACLVEQLARRKAKAVLDTLDTHEPTVVIAADTVVLDPDGQVQGKPRDAEDARRMLRALSGRRHEVFTGIAAIYEGKLAVDVQTTEVYFRTLTDAMIDAYIATGDPMDKAGAYGIQSRGSLLVERICGDYFNVVGLPLVRVDEMLVSAFGISVSDFT